MPSLPVASMAGVWWPWTGGGQGGRRPRVVAGYAVAVRRIEWRTACRAGPYGTPFN
ncbi:hypothetical protein [Streptomyces sp. NPDC056660]|uniref:hypothetical protein n=1 Tax=Streptomyces sp. NPDC056660 TaxID=3345897 RepID=UPI00368EDB2F